MALRSIVLFTLLTLTFSYDLNNVLFNDCNSYEFLDLTYPFDNSTVYYPGNQKFIFTKMKYFGENGTRYAAKEFAAAEHGGTHIDAPYHFNPKEKFVGEIPLTKLIVPLILVDVSSKVNDNPNFVLQQHDINYLNGKLGKPCVLIFKFGWSKYFYQPKKYLGLNEKQNTLNFPGVSVEVAKWITKHKNVVGVGVDVLSVDPGSVSATDNPNVHIILAKAGLYNLENVNLNNVHVPEEGCTALVLPMKIAQGTGAPLRFVAICPRKS